MPTINQLIKHIHNFIILDNFVIFHNLPRNKIRGRDYPYLHIIHSNLE